MSDPSGLPKTYDPASVEAEIYKKWLDSGSFVADPGAPGEPYCIVIPPPNVTGALHLGHAINNTLQDILIRRARMQGKNALWVPGIDHAGIATQAVVEKQLKEEENRTRHDIGREGLVERIWQWKEKYGNRILEQLKRLGCSCDWSRTRFTLDDMCARAVRETFFKLFKDGLIYRGKRLVNWDTHLQTSISDDEIYHETVKTHLWHIKYEITTERRFTTENTENTERREGREDSNRQFQISNLKSQISNAQSEISNSSSSSPSVPSVSSVVNHLVVATTRPETLLGDTAIAVNSQDPRWKWAIGKKVRLPLLNREIPIIADDILVDPKFGTGVVKVTPAHDPNDYAVWQRHQGKADEIGLINILNPDGTLNENAGPYAGMKRDAARKKVVADLESAGLLEKEEPYETQVGHSDRSKTAIEPYLSDQWFVKMAPLAEPALEVVREGIIQFFPQRYAQQYLAWLGEKRDWPISRQLWWGHRIPVWYRRIKIETQADADLAGEALGQATAISMIADVGGEEDDHSIRIQRADTGEPVHIAKAIAGLELGVYDFFVCLKHDEDGPQWEESGCIQDPDVLDTWFSSALWPHSTLGWPDDTADLRKWYPGHVLVTSRDIITLWVARMVMTGIYNMSDEATKRRSDGAEGADTSLAARHSPLATSFAIPFHHVHIHPTILDGKGERMSKSKGNGVDPVDIIETHGADALRFTLTHMATETQDARLPVKKLPNGKNTSEKFDLGRNFCTKLWNATRFALDAAGRVGVLTHHGMGEGTKARRHEGTEGGANLPDRWIVSRFARAVREADEAIETYRFDVYAKACYDFVWRDFCDWYLEAIKPALKDPARAPQTARTLMDVLNGALRLMHPVIPFITEKIWANLFSGAPSQIADRKSQLLFAPWPAAGATDDAAEAAFTKLQELITAIRNLRNEHKVDPRKPVTVQISANPAEVEPHRELIELLATCKLANIAPNLPPPDNAARVAAAGMEIYVEGLINAGAEQQREAKRREELTKEKATLEARLANESYIAKAPPHLVKQTQDQLAAVIAELQKLG